MGRSGQPSSDDAQAAINDDPIIVDRRAAAAAFLLAEALKPLEGESFANLRDRAGRTSLSRPNGTDPLIDLGRRDPVRAVRYERLVWTPRVLPLAQIRVWPGMDDLPLAWCVGTVPQVADRVRAGGVPGEAARMRAIWALTELIEREVLINWLLRIRLLVIPDVLLHDRPPLPGAPWSFDDGCTRAVVLCLLGVEAVAVFAGERPDQAPS